MSLSADVVNEALQLIGYDGPAVTGAAPNFDTSTAGQAAAELYAPAVAAVARMHSWDFARTSAVLTLTGNTPPFPWTFEYAFPENCVQVWQLVRPMADVLTPFDPTPQEWVRAANIVDGVQVSVIWANLANASLIFNGDPVESAWDPLFRAAVVRYLGSEFAVALLGKPDLSMSLFEQVGTLTQLGATRADN